MTVTQLAGPGLSPLRARTTLCAHAIGSPRDMIGGRPRRECARLVVEVVFNPAPDLLTVSLGLIEQETEARPAVAWRRPAGWHVVSPFRHIASHIASHEDERRPSCA